MITSVAVKRVVRKRISGVEPNSLQCVAHKTWEIAGAESRFVPGAFFLSGQLERVTGWAFAPEHPRREMMGGYELVHAPTRGYLLKGAVLVDGTLYSESACAYLQPRQRWWPQVWIERDIWKGAIFCTPGGNKYFGQWLMDDCVTYLMANREGVPITTEQPLNIHTSGYEDLLAMNPIRCRSVRMREAIIYDDVGQNNHKRLRFRGLSEKLLSNVESRPHPGVFILRGNTGMRRVLKNEMEIAQRLHEKRGFRVLDPEKADVPTIVATCAGARTVVGVEGSGLIHGILTLPPGGALLTLQPPNRFVSLYKHLTDRDRQHFGFVVGIPDGEDFRITPEEVERTLDLFPGQN